MRFRLATALLLVFCAVSALAQNCVPLLPVNNGQFKYTNENEIFHMEGSTATLVCDAGTALSGHTNSFRCQSGQWTPPVDTKCLRLRAADPGFGLFGQSLAACQPLNVGNGNAIYSAFGVGPFPEGTTLTLMCNLGFVPMGKPQARCENGQWTNIGQCLSAQSVRCPPLLPISNGQISYVASGNGPYDYGAIAQLNCNLGYTVVGVRSVTCEPLGWGPLSGLGTCQKGLGGSSGGMCQAATDEHGIVTHLGGSLGATQFPNGASAIVSCHLGYQGGGSSSCQGGTWTPPLKPCVAATMPGGIGAPLAMPGGTCMPLMMVFNGNIQYSQGGPFGPYNQGATASLQCNGGYQVSGAQQVTCQNGMWQPSTLGLCNPTGIGSGAAPGGVQCLPLTPQLNGQITYSQQGFAFPQGTTATFQCNQGSQLIGSPTSTCQNGQWTPTLGQCNNPNGLGTPGGLGGLGQCLFGMPAPFGGTVRHDRGEVGPYPEGSTATAQCNSGSLQGATTATCRGGAWNPPTFEMCSSLGSVGMTPAGIPGMNTCLGAPIAPFGATLSYNNGVSQFGPFNQGTSASLQCSNGRPVQGQPTTTCQNGQWNPPLGTCDMTPGMGGSPGGAAPCIFGLLPPGGQVDYSPAGPPYNHNTQATLRCLQGFQLQGTPQTTCQNGAWNPPLGTCMATGGGLGGLGNSNTNCYDLAYTPNGAFRYTPETRGATGAYSVGATATLQCNNGFVASPAGLMASCSASGWSTLFLGTCQQQMNSGGITNPNNQMGSCQFTPPAPANGRITVHAISLQPPYAPGALVTVSCNFGFIPSPAMPAAATCQNGQWTPSQLALCVSPNAAGGSCFSGLPNVNGGKIRYSNNAVFGPFPGGTSAELACDQPGVLRGEIHSTCIAGTWTPAGLGTCSGQLFNNPASPVVHNLVTVNQQCALMDQIVSHGVIEYSDRFNPTGPFADRVTASLTCNFGFVVSGNPKSVCESGMWQPNRLGECKAKGAVNVVEESSAAGCQPMQLKLSDGYLDTDKTSANGVFPHSTTATLQCKGGFNPQGEARSTCRNGRWEPSLGSCEKARDSGSAVQTCAALVPPFNGRISYIQASASHNYQLGTTAILNCELGYVVDGQAALSCTPGGWQPQPGFGQCRLNNEIYG